MKNNKSLSYKLMWLCVFLLSLQFIPVINALLFITPLSTVTTLLIYVLVFICIPVEVIFSRLNKSALLFTGLGIIILIIIASQYYPQYKHQQLLVNEIESTIAQELQQEPIEEYDQKKYDLVMDTVSAMGIVIHGFNVPAIYSEPDLQNKSNFDDVYMVHALLNDCESLDKQYLVDKSVLMLDNSCYYKAPSNPQKEIFLVRIEGDPYPGDTKTRDNGFIQTQKRNFYINDKIVHTQTTGNYMKLPFFPIPEFQCVFYIEGSGCSIEFKKKYTLFNRTPLPEDNSVYLPSKIRYGYVYDDVIVALGLSKKVPFVTHVETMDVLKHFILNNR